MANYNLDVKAIDFEKIDSAESALNAYKDAIDGHLNRLVSLSEEAYKEGFRGPMLEKKVKEFVDNSVAEMKKMSSFLDEFKEGLTKVEINYIAQSTGTTVSDVEKASVANEGDLTGVKPFN